MCLVPVPSVLVSPQFLALLEAPPKTLELSFSIKAGGTLHCKAVYYTDVRDETSIKEWEVRLPRISTLYKLITGEIK